MLAASFELAGAAAPWPNKRINHDAQQASVMLESRGLCATGEPVVITQRGRASAVLVSADAYERTQYENGLLRVLARGDADRTVSSTVLSMTPYGSPRSGMHVSCRNSLKGKRMPNKSIQQA